MTFQQDTDETPVLFRAYPDGEVLALFPTVPGTNDPYTCGSFVHVGQHGSADPHHCMTATRPAKPAEYAALKSELESAPYGYCLKIYKRNARRFLEYRREQLRRIAA